MKDKNKKDSLSTKIVPVSSCRVAPFVCECGCGLEWSGAGLNVFCVCLCGWTRVCDVNQLDVNCDVIFLLLISQTEPGHQTKLFLGLLSFLDQERILH